MSVAVRFSVGVDANAVELPMVVHNALQGIRVRVRAQEQMSTHVAPGVGVICARL